MLAVLDIAGDSSFDVRPSLTSATSTSAQLKLCMFPFDSSIAMFPEAYATSTLRCARELQPQLRDAWVQARFTQKKWGSVFATRVPRYPHCIEMQMPPV